MKRLCGHADEDPLVHAETCRVCWWCSRDPDFARLYECPIPGGTDVRWEEPEERGLGDWIESGLKSIGVTQDRVEAWLGGNCNCEERKKRLNRMTAWLKHKLGLGPEPKPEDVPPPDVVG